jgi:hypothetical protein
MQLVALPFELSSELVNLLLFAQTHNGSKSNAPSEGRCSIELDYGSSKPLRIATNPTV